MTMLTEQQFCEMFPKAGERLTAHLPYLGEALELGEINTPLRQAAFLAHVAHESGECRYTAELGDDHYLSYLEGRADLGNIYAGDGIRYKGRGLIQVTGRTNYWSVSNALGVDFIKSPELLETPQYAAETAAWFWRFGKPLLNPCADRRWFRVTTRLVNGGLNGLDDRLRFYQRNLRILDLPLYEPSAETRSIREFQAAHPPLVVDGDAGQRTLAALTATRA